jgi:hypothetical protein
MALLRLREVSGILVASPEVIEVLEAREQRLRQA